MINTLDDFIQKYKETADMGRIYLRLIERLYKGGFYDA